MIEPVSIFESITSQMLYPLNATPAFRHGEKYFLNGEFDNVNLSEGKGVVALFTPIVSKGMEQPYYPIMMMFGMSANFLEAPENTRPLLVKTFELSQQFLLRLRAIEDANQYRITSDIKNITRTEFENQYDVNLCGHLVVFDWYPMALNSECII